MIRAVARSVRERARYMAYLRRVRDPYWARRLMASGVRPSTVRAGSASRSVIVEDVGVPITPRHGFLLSARDSVQALRGIGASLAIDPSGALRCRIGSAEHFVNSEEEMRILVEIRVLGVYNFLLDDPRVVIDIGMNVGFASLYFAERADCLVYGFEPVRDTFEAAQRNLSLNPALADRITVCNAGLGAEDRRTTFRYNPEWKGLTGVETALGRSLPEGESVSTREVEIRDVRRAFAQIADAHPNRKLVLKIDCEGSEYEIVEALVHSGQIARAHMLLIEWHNRGPAPLTELLCQAGYSLLSFTPHDRWSGMVYAVRDAGAMPRK